MYLHIWSIVVIRNWHWCQVRVHTLTYLRTVREFMYVDLNRNHQSTHKFDYNFFWMGVTNWNFYHLAENVFTAFVLEQREQKECRQTREGEGIALRSIQVQHVHLAYSPPSTVRTPTPLAQSLAYRCRECDRILESSSHAPTAPPPLLRCHVLAFNCFSSGHH